MRPGSMHSGRPAADRLFDLTRGRVRCVKQDEDRYRRVVARRSGPGTPDLGRRMVRDGLASGYRRYSGGDYALTNCGREGTGSACGGRKSRRASGAS